MKREMNPKELWCKHSSRSGREGEGLTWEVTVFPAERDSAAGSFIVQLFRIDFE